jgi:hypothetical protein
MSGGPQATGKSQGDKPVSGALDTDPQDLSSVRQATDLALNHLRDSIRSTDDEMLKELGWTREQAEAFLQRWEAMQKAAENGNQRQQQAFEHLIVRGANRVTEMVQCKICCLTHGRKILGICIQST